MALHLAQARKVTFVTYPVYISRTVYTQVVIELRSSSLCPQLHAMPALNFVLQHLIYQLVLLYDRQALELGRFDLDRVHGPTAAADVLDLYQTC
jgi:hypothetical protein